MTSNLNTVDSLIFGIMGLGIAMNVTSMEGQLPDNIPFSPLLTALRTSFAILNSLLIITGNIFSLSVMKSVSSPCFPPSTRVFLSYVILSDLAQGFCAVSIIGPAALNYWPYGNFLCRASCTAIMWICSCCVNAVILITLDRLLAVIYPLRHATLISRRRAVHTIIVASISSLGFALPLHISSVEITYNNSAMMCLPKWSNGTTACLIHLIILGCLTAFIPAMIVTCCHTKLYLAAHKHVRRHAKLQATTSSCNSQSNAGQTWANTRALKMCSLIAGTFCIAWFPYILVSIRNYIEQKEATPLVDFICNHLCVCNSWWDVIIYFFMTQEFRRTAVKLVCGRRSNNNPPSNGHAPIVRFTRYSRT